jgi:glycosyltransferase involved in cell wall biosynthesis
MKTPQVSVILTVYKRTEYLAEALNSVLAQTFRDCEIIVADDSGTGAAKETVLAAGQSDRLVYLANTATLGVAMSVANAVRQARGEFLAILNDDDLWEADLLAELAAPLACDPNCVLATSDHWIMDRNGRIDAALSESWTLSFGRAGLARGVVKDGAGFVVDQCGAAINVASVFRKDAVDWSLVVPQVAGAYDYWIACLLAAARKPIYYVPKRLGRWRVHGAMETGRRSHDRNENMVYIYSTLLERGWFPELKAVLRAKLAEALYVVGHDKLQFGRASEARSYWWRSFLLHRRLRPLAQAAASFLPGPVRGQLKACRDSLRPRESVAVKEKESVPPLKV